MRLFDTFEAIKFPQEDIIFITRDEYLYYIYDSKYKQWRKHSHAGNDQLTVSNYPDVSREELTSAMQGVFPQKETDFIRLCNLSQLCIRDMMDLLREDYENYMSDYVVYHTIHQFLSESDICYKSFEEIQKILNIAVANRYDNDLVVAQMQELSLKIIGRDIFRREIGIVDGHDNSSYFWILPVRIIDYSDTDEINNVSEMRSAEISIEEDDVGQYLTPFLYRYYDDDLEANKRRIEDCWIDDNGNKHMNTVHGFEWYLTHNFFTFDSIRHILEDIADTVDALVSGRETEYTKKLKINMGSTTNTSVYANNQNEEEISKYNDNSPTEDDTEVELVIDFYQRFIYRMEYMMKVGAEKGYNLISFMGP